MKQQAFLIDCMEYMKTIPDKYFDLAVVDPPYGSGAAPEQGKIGGGIVTLNTDREVVLAGGLINTTLRQRRMG